jgi:hypothetical protein
MNIVSRHFIKRDPAARHLAAVKAQTLDCEWIEHLGDLEDTDFIIHRVQQRRVLNEQVY